MFAWFRRKTERRSDAVEAFAKKWFGPPALVLALAEGTAAYAKEVRAGQVTSPAHRRRNASVVEIWRDARLEALSFLFNFGRSEPGLAAGPRRQLELLTCLVDERPHLEWPQPRDEHTADTLQAVSHAYLYLHEAGSEVVDRESDAATLKAKGRDIFEALMAQETVLRNEWATFVGAVKQKDAPLPEMPRTLIEAIYEDVTMKTKSIALSAQFGPKYESVIRTLEDDLRKRGGNVEEFRAIWDRVLQAEDPDEFTQTRHS